MSIKKILLVYKKSVYKHYFLDRKIVPSSLKFHPEMKDRFKKTHQRHYDALGHVENVLKGRQLSYHKISRGKIVDMNDYDLIITIGGDGTFLEAARHIKKQKILGLNSDPIWSVGRFCYANHNNFEDIIGKILTGKAKVEKINRLILKLKRQKINVNILNDILVCHKSPAAMSRYYIDIKSQKEEHRSSGVWVSTAAGSTGAILSSGGKEMSLRSQKFQYKVRELYSNRKNNQSLTGGILSSSEKMRFSSLMKDGVVFVDGSHVFFPFPFGEDASVVLSKEPLNVICQ